MFEFIKKKKKEEEEEDGAKAPSALFLILFFFPFPSYIRIFSWLSEKLKKKHLQHY